jgi:hypothetical protein
MAFLRRGKSPHLNQVAQTWVQYHKLNEGGTLRPALSVRTRYKKPPLALPSSLQWFVCVGHTPYFKLDGAKYLVSYYLHLPCPTMLEELLASQNGDILNLIVFDCVIAFFIYLLGVYIISMS